ncbi:MAG: hypothetical protein ACLVHS_10705 [Blautia wexlerae]
MRSFFEMERMPFVRDVPIQELYESPAMSETLVKAGSMQQTVRCLQLSRQMPDVENPHS